MNKSSLVVHSLLMVVLMIGCSASASIAGSEPDGANSVSSTSTLFPALEPRGPQPDPHAPPAPPNDPSKPAGKNPSDWDVAIYPILAWVPIFGADITVPPLPSNPIAAPPSASTSTSFNGAAFAGYRIEKSKWRSTGQFLWAGLSGHQDTPQASIHLNILYGQLMGGREILPNLFLEGGFRRMALKISAQVEGSPEENRKPGLWDPLVGMTYRRHLGRKWRIDAHMDGGGFGVGSDVTLAGSFLAEWQFARHFGLNFGAEALHFRITNTVDNETVKIDQTMYGPVFGFGILF